MGTLASLLAGLASGERQSNVNFGDGKAECRAQDGWSRTVPAAARMHDDKQLRTDHSHNVNVGVRFEF